MSTLDQAEAGARIALDDLREAMRVAMESTRSALRVVETIDGLPALLTEFATVADEMTAFVRLHPEPLAKSTDEVRAEWSALCMRQYANRERLAALARAYVASHPLCERCEKKPATDGPHCAGCHDFIGQRQDERAAS